MSKHHKILGVRLDATLVEIKKAYRKKAFELHPDRNKNENAEQQFIEITVAYEYLTQKKKSILPFYETDFNTSTNNDGIFEQNTYEEWKHKAKERAQQQAQYRYEEFKKKNDAFKRTAAYPFVKFFTLFTILVSAGFTIGFISIPFLAIYLGGGFWMFLLSCFYTLPGIYAYKSTRELIETYRIHY